jgi:hypothetical protein
VAHPILHIGAIKLTLPHVHSQRMTENMDVLPIGRYPGCLRVLAEGMSDERCRNRLPDPLSAREEMTRPGGAWLPKVVPEQPLC